jgi:hypothetical protein
MITNNGKEVLSKFLLGQAPSYATHISVGCGATPLDPNDGVPSDMATKKTLDFEMLRVPISSRGFVEDGKDVKLSFTAQLPTENRYEITEVGLWSNGSNSLARGFDSRMIFDFEEGWQAHGSSLSPIVEKTPLGENGTIEDGGDKIFRVSTDNSILAATQRFARKEGPRFLNTSIFMRGDSSNIISEDVSITTATSNGTKLTYIGENSFIKDQVISISGCSNPLFNVSNAVVDSATETSFSINKIVSSSEASLSGISWTSGSWTPEENILPGGFISEHIHLNNIIFDIGNNSPSDMLSLAVSVVDRTALGNGVPEFVKIMIEFFRNETNTGIGFAKKEIYIDGAEFSDRYKTIRFPISDLFASPDFSASEIRIARVFAFIGVYDQGSIVGSNQHYLSLDGFRLDNISTENPLYKMVGYSPVRTSDGKPIIKFKNTNNYVEFRFGLGVT